MFDAKASCHCKKLKFVTSITDFPVSSKSMFDEKWKIAFRNCKVY